MPELRYRLFRPTTIISVVYESFDRYLPRNMTVPLVHLGSLSRKISKGQLLAFLCERGGIDGSKVGQIELRPGEAAIEVPAAWQSRLTKALDGQELNGRRVRAWMTSTAKPGENDHFDRLAHLLELESQAEAQQAAERARRLSPEAAERSGTSLVELMIIDEESGLGGRYLLQLAKPEGRLLPWTRLSLGSPVTLTPEGERKAVAWRGVVSQRTEKSIQVALAHFPDETADFDSWRIDLTSDEIGTDRQRRALHTIGGAHGDRLAELKAILLGEATPHWDEPPQATDLKWLNPQLNRVQQSAVEFALAADDLALIHGPPGTGKTTTVVELIRQAVVRGEKVLACAPSNTAVDNLFERLLAAGESAVRLGHPARVMEGLRSHTLDLLVDDHPDVKLARKLVKQAMGLFRQADRYTRAKPLPGARREARQEAKSLLADARRLENQTAQQILNEADILCATTTSLDSSLLGTRHFDLAVIDEACQSTEPGCLIPWLWCDRVVLAGDHCQLPPTVISREAAAAGFQESLFERLLAVHGEGISRRLTVQYRMHEAIMEFSSLEFYDAELTAHESVREHRLCDMVDLPAIALTKKPLELIDTAGASYDEEIEPDGESRRNPREAAFVVHKVRQLLESGLAAEEIAVIAPYAAQVRQLRELLAVPGLEIDSVDGFQGREKEAVVISLVRSNDRGEIGFLRDVRRMNVALTRARRKLIVVGDSATLSSDPFYCRLIEHFEAAGAYRSVWEEDWEV